MIALAVLALLAALYLAGSILAGDVLWRAVAGFGGPVEWEE